MSEFERLKKQKDEIVARQITDLEKQIESLKAITELAVKGFKDILAMYMLWIDADLDCDKAASNMDDIAENTLSEIERLQNDQT